MSDLIHQAITYFRDHKLSELEILKEFLKIKTVSSDSNYLDEMERGANWLAEYFASIGAIDIKILETDKHPVVFSQLNGTNRDAPTVLIYGHYDVQPPDPIDLWHSPPFEPEIRDGNIFARGASDMKGQIMIVLSAIKSIQENGDLPVNFKFFIEGEEEIGSPGMLSFLEKNKNLFKSDFVLNLDAGMISKEKPTIVYGLRGIAYFEIYIEGPKQDLHSGLFGGVVRNPLQVLCEIIAGMKDEDAVIQLPEFYDDVLAITEKEKISLSKLGMDEDFYLEQTGANKIHGEKGYSPIERVGTRPTLDVNGLMGGYTGEGPKTVIPSKAMAKLSMRLVPNQTPEKVEHQLCKYLSEKVPKDIQWDVKKLSSDPACITNLDFYAVRCFAEALESVWSTEPVYLRGGGSIPIVSYFKSILGIESVLGGFSLPDDNIHSPNEKLNLEMYEKGVEAVIHFICQLSEEHGE